MSTNNNNNYLNSLQHIITSLNDDKIKDFGSARNFSVNLENPSNRIHPFEDVVENNITVQNLNLKKNGVLSTISEMKKKLSDSNNENKQFMDILSKNLQYYNTVVVNIIDKINQIFDLIKSLDITKGTPSIGQPGPEPRTEPPNRQGQNDELIKELVDTINKYLNEFNILKSNIDTVVGNNRILREELSKKSNDLFGNIKKLDDLFLTRFKELGIFQFNNKLVTFKQIQNKMIEKGNTETIFNRSLRNFNIFYNFFFDNGGNPKTYTYNNNTLINYNRIQKILNDEVNVISNKLQLGGSKRIKNRKTKRRKPKRKSVKRKKTKYFQTIL